MDKESVERLVRVEESQKTLITLFKEYMEKPCAERGCSHHDDVMSLRNTQKNIRRVSWAGVLAIVTTGITYLFKGVANVG